MWNKAMKFSSVLGSTASILQNWRSWHFIKPTKVSKKKHKSKDFLFFFLLFYSVSSPATPKQQINRNKKSKTKTKHTQESLSVGWLCAWLPRLDKSINQSIHFNPSVTIMPKTSGLPSTSLAHQDCRYQRQYRYSVSFKTNTSVVFEANCELLQFTTSIC